jgi:hypothetical protein
MRYCRRLLDGNIDAVLTRCGAVVVNGEEAEVIRLEDSSDSYAPVQPVRQIETYW